MKTTRLAEKVWNFKAGRPWNSVVMVPFKTWRKFYVYAWFDKGRVFYIGKGSRGRGLAKHESNGKNTLAQDHREAIGRNFYCVLVKDNLTESSSYKMEAELIDILKPAGNRTGPRVRPRTPNQAWAYVQKIKEAKFKVNQIKLEKKAARMTEVKKALDVRRNVSLADHVKNRLALENCAQNW